MYTYLFYQWMFLFFVYCFLGWCIESTIVSVSKRRLVNRGFLRAPMLPLYGSGACLILLLTLPYKDNLWLVYFSGLIGATILEYVTGWGMEALFKMKYWDYSNQRFQLHGRICLSSSLFWGVLSVALTEFIHPPIAQWMLRLNQTFVLVFSLCVALVMLCDTIISAKAALDLAKLLERLDTVRKEAERIHVQLEVLKENALEQLDSLKENAQEQLDSLKENAQEQLDSFKENAQEQLGSLKENAGEQLDALRLRLSELKEQQDNEYKKLGFFKSQLIKGHPSAYSKKFNTALKELRELLNSEH